MAREAARQQMLRQLGVKPHHRRSSSAIASHAARCTLGRSLSRRGAQKSDFPSSVITELDGAERAINSEMTKADASTERGPPELRLVHEWLDA